MGNAAQAEGKLKQLNDANVQWQKFENDFHNYNSPVRQLLSMAPDETAKISNHFIRPGDSGPRAITTLARNGADVTPIRQAISKGTAPVKTDGAESGKLRAAGNTQDYINR